MFFFFLFFVFCCFSFVLCLFSPSFVFPLLLPHLFIVFCFFPFGLALLILSRVSMISGFNAEDLAMEDTIHAAEEIELKSGLPPEEASYVASYNSWRTTWEPDTILESTPPNQNATALSGVSVGSSARSGAQLAFPSALNAVNEMTPRTPGDVNIVVGNLSRSMLNRTRSTDASLASAASAASAATSKASHCGLERTRIET